MPANNAQSKEQGKANEWEPLESTQAMCIYPENLGEICKKITPYIE